MLPKNFSLRSMGLMVVQRHGHFSWKIEIMLYMVSPGKLLVNSVQNWSLFFLHSITSLTESTFVKFFDTRATSSEFGVPPHISPPVEWRIGGLTRSRRPGGFGSALGSSSSGMGGGEPTTNAGRGAGGGGGRGA